MNTTHLTEEEIQQYVLDNAGSETRIINHIRECKACASLVVAYTSLFKAISEQPAPSFDFDIAESVMSKLPAPKEATATGKAFLYGVITIAVIFISTLWFAFHEYLGSLFINITPLFTYLIITAFATLTILLGIDLYRNYKTKLNALDIL